MYLLIHCSILSDIFCFFPFSPSVLNTTASGMERTATWRPPDICLFQSVGSRDCLCWHWQRCHSTDNDGTDKAVDVFSAILNHFPSASPLTYFPNPFLCFQSLTGSSDWQPVVKKVLEEVQRGISGRWTVPVMVAEMRHIVPTIAGLPLELGLCAAMVAQAAADGELGMPNSAAPPQ